MRNPSSDTPMGYKVADLMIGKTGRKGAARARGSTGPPIPCKMPIPLGLIWKGAGRPSCLAKRYGLRARWVEGLRKAGLPE